MATILSVSVPPDLRPLLDAEAGRQRRSRSFIVVEAVREYLERMADRAFEDARERTVREGLRLSPAERVRLAEDLWQEFAHRHRPAGPWTAAFDTFDAYEGWRRERNRKQA